MLLNQNKSGKLNTLFTLPTDQLLIYFHDKQSTSLRYLCSRAINWNWPSLGPCFGKKFKDELETTTTTKKRIGNKMKYKIISVICIICIKLKCILICKFVLKIISFFLNPCYSLSTKPVRPIKGTTIQHIFLIN